MAKLVSDEPLSEAERRRLTDAMVTDEEHALEREVAACLDRLTEIEARYVQEGVKLSIEELMFIDQSGTAGDRVSGVVSQVGATISRLKAMAMSLEQFLAD